MRYKDLDGDVKEDLDKIINKSFYTPMIKKLDKNKNLCFTCKGFEFAKTEFNIIYAHCGYFFKDLRVNPDDPIIECTNYMNKNIMNLQEMKEIAYLIDNKDKKIGFTK